MPLLNVRQRARVVSSQERARSYELLLMLEIKKGIKLL
jgi:hypothetical protein